MIWPKHVNTVTSELLLHHQWQQLQYTTEYITISFLSQGIAACCVWQVFYQFTKYSEEKGVAGVAVKIASNMYGGVGGGGVQNGWMSLTSDPSFED